MTILLYALIEIIALLLFAVGTQKKGKNAQNVCFFMTWLILSSLIAFRDITVGRDYKTYHYAMIRVTKGVMLNYDYTWLSIGFRLLIKAVSILGFSAKNTALIVSAIFAGATIYFFLKAILKHSSNPVLSLFMLFSFCYVFQSMNQFRQMFAVALVLYSFEFLDKSFWKYCIVIIIAGLMHSSALIMLPMYFIVKIAINKKLILAYFFASLSVIALWPLIRHLISYTRYSYYLGWDIYDIGATSSSITNLIVRVILLLFCLFFWKDITTNYKKGNYLFHFALLCTVLQVVAVYVHMFARITTYFYVFYLLLIPEVVCVLKRKFTKSSRRIIMIAIYCFFLMYQVVYYNAQAVEGGFAVYKLLGGL